MIEHMFDTESDPATLLLQRMCSAARAESCAAAARLVAIGELVSLRLAEDGGASQDWTVDATDAVAIEVSVALGISRGLAASHLRYAHALRVQLPALGRVFVAGDIDEATFRAAVFRTGLITDDDLRAAVDAQLAVKAPRWGVLDRSQLAARIDQIIARADRDAVRVRKDRLAEREVLVGDVGNGLAEIVATVYAPDGHAVADRLTALAHTVCPDDPRTMAQRRSDGFGALAAGADRLACRCGRADCPAGGNTASAVVIHVIAEQATVEGTGDTPAAMIGYDGLIPAELIAELAKTSRLPAADPSRGRARRNRVPAVEGVGRLRPPPRPDLPLPQLRRPGQRLRHRPRHPPRRRRTHPRLEPVVQMPIPSPTQDVLGLARRTTPRRHPDLDQPRPARRPSPTPAAP